jgi:hypothetical protein
MVSSTHAGSPWYANTAPRRSFCWPCSGNATKYWPSDVASVRRTWVANARSARLAQCTAPPDRAVISATLATSVAVRRRVMLRVLGGGRRPFAAGGSTAGGPLSSRSQASTADSKPPGGSADGASTSRSSATPDNSARYARQPEEATTWSSTCARSRAAAIPKRHLRREVAHDRAAVEVSHHAPRAMTAACASRSGYGS